MLIKDIIKNALFFAGRVDLADGIDGDLTAEAQEAVDTLLFCVNAVEDELARCYLPLKTSETLTTSDGKIGYSQLSKRAVKILSVIKDGKKVEFSQDSQGVATCEGKVTVEYCFAPAAKTLSGSSEFSSLDAGDCLVAAGAASEYCLIRGDATGAEIWEKRYRREVEAAQKRREVEAAQKGRAVPREMPPRRWV